jgi:hypothetical protein
VISTCKRRLFTRYFDEWVNSLVESQNSAHKKNDKSGKPDSACYTHDVDACRAVGYAGPCARSYKPGIVIKNYPRSFNVTSEAVASIETTKKLHHLTVTLKHACPIARNGEKVYDHQIMSTREGEEYDLIIQTSELATGKAPSVTPVNAVSKIGLTGHR